MNVNNSNKKFLVGLLLGILIGVIASTITVSGIALNVLSNYEFEVVTE